MAMDGAILDQLNQKAESLKPGSEIVIKMTQEELNKHLQGRLKDGSFFEYDPKKNQVIIYKPKKENVACAEEALDSGLNVQDAVDACSDSDNFANKIIAEGDRDTKKYNRRMEQKKNQLTQKLKKMERVALMNPSRELRDMVKLYNKELHKKYIDIDKFYEKVKEAHRAILAPGSYIDSDTYNNFITSGAVKMIIGDLKKKLNSSYYKKYENKINEIIKMLEDIDKNSKHKNIGLA